jgi:hypothetical protein
MLVKTTGTPSARPSKIVSIQGSANQLKSLYARRTAVNALIQSLEDYQRFRAQSIENRESKTA